MPDNTETLKLQYQGVKIQASRLCDAIFEQLLLLLEDRGITLGVPMESRVKEWTSIEEKLERKNLKLDSILTLPDLVGVRIILLFRADLEKVDGLIRETFDVLSSEDTSERLGDTQFGYQSQHYIAKVPTSWLAVPTMSDLGDLQVEFQVRTLAQHIWAAASHKLQYKNESSVPPPIRRAINRASALLETVDLEFDRVLSERESYKEIGIAATDGSEPLNVDLLVSILSQVFPKANREPDEDFEELLQNLKSLSVLTVHDLHDLVEEQIDHALECEAVEVETRKKDNDFRGTTEERLDKGVFYTHVGLGRMLLEGRFGSAKLSAVIRKQAEE